MDIVEGLSELVGGTILGPAHDRVEGGTHWVERSFQLLDALRKLFKNAIVRLRYN